MVSCWSECLTNGRYFNGTVQIPEPPRTSPDTEISHMYKSDVFGGSNSQFACETFGIWKDPMACGVRLLPPRCSPVVFHCRFQRIPTKPEFLFLSYATVWHPISACVRVCTADQSIGWRSAAIIRSVLTVGFVCREHRHDWGAESHSGPV